MDKLKPLIASVIWPLALLLGVAVHAAPFDPSLRAPKVATPQELRGRLQTQFATVQQKRDDQTPGAFVRDRAAHQQWSDIRFAMEMALDEGRSLGDLSSLGLKSTSGGGYEADLKQFPHWAPSQIGMLSNPQILEGATPALKARGFRDSDLDAVRTYIQNHHAEQDSFAERKELAGSFVQRLQARKAAGQAVDRDEVLSYVYQQNRLIEEARREWAVGLLDVLDKQRQRALLSFLDEMGGTLKLGAPKRVIDERIQQTVAPMLSGNYMQMLEQQEAAMRRGRP
jgi:hypothetical protein